MIFVVTPQTVSNPRALRGGTPPRKILDGLQTVYPRGGIFSPVFWRLVPEYQILRYSVALSPFPIAMLIWPELALPISGAPLLMFLLVIWVESNLLTISDKSRRLKLMDDASVARGLDLFAQRGRAILTRIAAGRGMETGELLLVVEQTAMAPVPPLTFVSVQAAVEGGPVLDLDEAERALIADTLFDDALPERHFHRINLRENVFLRSVALEARSISAHARMAALARAAAG